MGITGKFLGSIIILAIAIMAFNFVKIFKPLSTYTAVNDKCEILSGTLAVEDFVEFGDYLLGSADNRRGLWGHGSIANEVENGHIVLFNPKSKKITKITEIEGFPKKVAFHPHGLSIHGKNLYAINHAYRKGSERVEVIQVNLDEKTGKVTLKYLRSLVFGDDYQGMLNDLAVIDENKFYVTTWKSHPDTLDGPVNGPMETIKVFGFNLLGFKLTKLLYCDGYQDDYRPNCKEIPEGKAHMNNGITLDDTNSYLYVSDLLVSQVRKFKVDGDKLTLVETIDTVVHGDNLTFDKSTGKIYAAGMFDLIAGAKVMDSFTKGTELSKDFVSWAGATTIDTKNGNKVSTAVNQKDFFRGISVAIVTKNGLVLGSFYEDGVMMCPL
jgi:sugar lactone lactonase YvrE